MPMVCGPPMASSMMDKGTGADVGCHPFEITEMVQIDCAAKLVPQLLVWENGPVDPSLMPLMVRVVLPELVRVISCGTPNSVKVKEPGEAVIGPATAPATLWPPTATETNGLT